jgi:hypothetical protein
MRRLLLGLGTLALLGLAGCFMAYLRLPKPSITKANFDRIELGATAKEVTAILGPPTAPPPGVTKKKWALRESGGTYSPRWLEEWMADGAIIRIEYAPKESPFSDWQVTHQEYDELPPEPFLDRLRRRLPW